MNMNTDKLRQEKLTKLTTRFVEIKAEIERVSKLLAITQPVKLTAAQPAEKPVENKEQTTV